MSEEAEYFSSLSRNLIVLESVEDAASMKTYLKGKFDFYGIKQSPRRAVFNRFVKDQGLPPYEKIGPYLHWLYNASEREYDYCALELLIKLKRHWNDEVIDHAQYLITHNSWWDTVDLVATNIVGAYLFKNPDLIEKTIDPWIESSDMWLNRTAIIFQLKYKDQTRTDYLVKSILPHIHSGEFFHQKAIGWALRQYSKFNPEWVRGFVQEHELKPLSYREAVRLMT